MPVAHRSMDMVKGIKLPQPVPGMQSTSPCVDKVGGTPVKLDHTF